MELVKGVETGYMPFPCGKCPACVRRRVSGWAFRLNKQSEQSNSAHFVTLTYNDEHIKKTKNGFETLVKKDVQDFFKRLRKLTKQKIILLLQKLLIGCMNTKTRSPTSLSKFLKNTPSTPRHS